MGIFAHVGGGQHGGCADQPQNVMFCVGSGNGCGIGGAAGGGHGQGSDDYSDKQLMLY